MSLLTQRTTDIVEDKWRMVCSIVFHLTPALLHHGVVPGCSMNANEVTFGVAKHRKTHEDTVAGVMEATQYSRVALFKDEVRKRHGHAARGLGDASQQEIETTIHCGRHCM